MRKIFMVGNTHFDPVWLWKWDESMASIRATFRAALERMKEDKDFIYSFSSPPVFEWIKKTEPDLFNEIKQRVSEGRWELSEGWWVQPDCCLASGESYVRQGLYARKYLKKTFGKTPDNVFNVDSFGHSPQLPQILKKSGINSYCFVRPEKKYLSLTSQRFLWRGIDGSSVTAFRFEEPYAKNLELCINEQSDKENDISIIYGVTDHGGAPTKKMIAEIHNKKDTVFSSVSRFFSQAEGPLPVVAGELLTGDFGIYSNYPKIKALNRKAETAVLNAEAASVLSGNYDRDKLEACWRDILFNQFHDIIGGACIKDAYFDAENMLGRALHTASEIIHFNLQNMTAKIDTSGETADNMWNLVVWNLNGREYDGCIEAEVQWAHEFEWYDKGIELCDGEGLKYQCQIIKEKSVIPGFRSRFAFKANIPPFSYRVFKVIQTGIPVKNKTADTKYIKTDKYEIFFSDSGYIKEILRVKDGKNVCGRLLEPVCYTDKGDTWCFNTSGYGNEKLYFKLSDTCVIESGDIRTVIKLTYHLNQSVLYVYYTFYENEDYFDAFYSVNWNEKFLVFKFESDVSEHHVASVPYGAVKRNGSNADVPMGSWLSSGGITFFADSIFSYNVTENGLGLTVLRSPIYGDLRMREIDLSLDYDIVSRGINEGRLRVSLKNATYPMAQDFLNPPVVICESNHSGDKKFALPELSLEAESAMISAVKQSEYEDCLIIRAFEYTGNYCKSVLKIGDDCFGLKFTPFEIKTLKYLSGKLSSIPMNEEIGENE